MEQENYLQFHRKRFDYLFGLVTELKPAAECRVLDVGPGPFTERLKTHYREVWSLGFEETPIFGKEGEGGDRHIVFDLREAMDHWVELPACDLIVFAEVIEHVHAEPSRLLAFLATGLKPDGLLVCQTPNAVALHKRLASLAGRASYNRWGSGHVTEFTKAELVGLGERVGLRRVRHEFRNYFGYEGSVGKRAAMRVLDVVTGPFPSLRRGQTIVYQTRMLAHMGGPERRTRP
ncbi:MAG: class I SAM-dependent methyltransferase [Planctomycetota bacterium]